MMSGNLSTDIFIDLVLVLNIENNFLKIHMQPVCALLTLQFDTL